MNLDDVDFFFFSADLRERDSLTKAAIFNFSLLPGDIQSRVGSRKTSYNNLYGIIVVDFLMFGLLFATKLASLKGGTTLGNSDIRGRIFSRVQLLDE
jgi:hypothetical protein